MPRKRKNPFETVIGEHAKVFQVGGWEYVRHKDHPDFGRLDKHPLKGKVRRQMHYESMHRTMSFSCGYALASLLFPRNFVRQTATGLPEKMGEIIVQPTYSSRAKLDSKSERGARAYYKVECGGGSKADNLAWLAHLSRVKKSLESGRVKKAMEILEKAGFSVDMHAANILFRPDGEPVFFKLFTIDLPKAKKWVSKMKKSGKKESAESLMDGLAQVQPSLSSIVHVHRSAPSKIT